MTKKLTVLALMLVAVLILVACGGEATPTPTPEEAAPAPTEAPMEEPTEAPMEEPTEAAPAGEVSFFSTQFVPVEEQEKFRAILQEGGYDFTGTEEGPLLDLVLAGAESGQSEVDVIGALHGTFPPLQREDALMNMIDIADDLSADREFAQAFLNTGLLGTDDFLYYIPWMQATYIMAANTEALDYLPEGADVNALTWEQLGEWCQTLLDETGEPKCGLPHAGLFHRFLEGYLWPSFTGGMVTNFKSEDAVTMMEWARDSLWPTVNPESINYEFMQEPLLSGDVWVAFDHTARLLDAFSQQPEDFVAFPAPAGPEGRGFMPVIVGLGIPEAAPNPDGGAALIDFLTQPSTQEEVLQQLGFFPVVAGVDTSALPEGIDIEAGAVSAQANASDALPALLPVGLGERGGEINQIYRNAFDRIVLDGEDIVTVLDEEAANLQALLDETGAACWAPDPPSDGPCQVNP
jgi:multiple sugar transport system substrate-binding protein